MRFATLICWLVTASLGAFMLHTWLARGGLDREGAKAGGLPPQLIFGHAAAREAPGPTPAQDAPPPGEQPEFTVSDEMIARLLANPAPPRRPGPIRPNPAVFVPVAHGFAAIGTFLLAVTSAIT